MRSAGWRPRDKPDDQTSLSEQLRASWRTGQAKAQRRFPSEMQTGRARAPKATVAWAMLTATQVMALLLILWAVTDGTPAMLLFGPIFGFTSFFTTRYAVWAWQGKRMVRIVDHAPNKFERAYWPGIKQG